MLGQAAARGRGAKLKPRDGRDGIRSNVSADAIGYASLRGGSVAGEHVVILGPEERLILAHRADSRMIFARGALAAARFLVGKTGRPLFDARRDRRIVSGRETSSPGLVRRLGLFDATMLVMGGIIGSGIFVTPAEVARHVDTPLLIVGVWILGGLVALAGSFVYAELAARRPEVGGQYAYLRDAYGPMPAFLYGWALLLVIQSGGMAAVAITFARYFGDLVQLSVARRCHRRVGARAAHLDQLPRRPLRQQRPERADGAQDPRDRGAGARRLAVRSGQRAAASSRRTAGSGSRPSPAIGAAMTPVMFSYGGWQTSSFVAGEMRDPRRDLARGLLFGVAGVVILYTAVAFVCVHALGPPGLPRRRPRRPTSCGWRSANAARPSSPSASRSRPSASSARAC